MSQPVEGPVTPEALSSAKSNTLDPIEEITRKMYWGRARAWASTFILCGLIINVATRLFDLSSKMQAANAPSWNSLPVAGPSGWDWAMFGASVWLLLFWAAKTVGVYNRLDSLRCEKTALIVTQQLDRD